MNSTILYSDRLGGSSNSLYTEKLSLETISEYNIYNCKVVATIFVVPTANRACDIFHHHSLASNLMGYLLTD